MRSSPLWTAASFQLPLFSTDYRAELTRLPEFICLITSLHGPSRKYSFPQYLYYFMLIRCLETNVIWEPFASNGCFSGSTVLALSKYVCHNVKTSALMNYFLKKRSPLYQSYHRRVKSTQESFAVKFISWNFRNDEHVFPVKHFLLTKTSCYSLLAGY
jgi:hypothetical protein